MGMIKGEPPNLFHGASIYRSYFLLQIVHPSTIIFPGARGTKTLLTVTSGVRGDSPREKSGGFNISLDIKPLENQSAFVSGQIMKQSFKIFKFIDEWEIHQKNKINALKLCWNIGVIWYYLLLMEIIKKKMIKNDHINMVQQDFSPWIVPFESSKVEFAPRHWGHIEKLRLLRGTSEATCYSSHHLSSEISSHHKTIMIYNK